MRTGKSPARGEVWDVNFEPTVGRRQGRCRPALIVSANALNSSVREIVMVIPTTGTDRGLPTHVSVAPPEGGLTKPSVMMVEQLRSVSQHRLGSCRGQLWAEKMDEVVEVIRIVLEIQ